MPAKITRISLSVISVIMFLVLLFYTIGSAVTGNMNYTQNNDEIYDCYGAAGCIYLMDKNHIKIEESYRENIKKRCQKLIHTTILSNLGTTELAKYICMDYALDLGLKDVLFSEFHSRFDEKTQFFIEYKNKSNYDGWTDDQILQANINATNSVWITFDSFGLKDPEYDLQALSANTFNQYSYQYVRNDVYTSKWTISNELENIFYYFLCTDSIHLLNYEEMWKIVGSDYTRDLFETNEGKESFTEFSISNIAGILTDIKAKEYFKINIQPKYQIQEYFNLLNTEEAFFHSQKDYENNGFEYVLFLNLCQPDTLDLAQNEYFTKNINQWLVKNFETNWN